MALTVLDQAEFADNPEPRCPVVLLLDTSGSMHGAAIGELNDGLRAFKEAIQADRLAALRVEVAIVPFGGSVKPIDVRAVRAARDTGGAYLTVSDDEILSAIAALGRDAAIFAEPAGAAAYAGLVKAVQQGLVRSDETIVVVNTGSGLKDVRAATRAAPAPTVIEPTLDALKKVIGNL